MLQNVGKKMMNCSVIVNIIICTSYLNNYYQVMKKIVQVIFLCQKKILLINQIHNMITKILVGLKMMFQNYMLNILLVIILMNEVNNNH